MASDKWRYDLILLFLVYSVKGQSINGIIRNTNELSQLLYYVGNLEFFTDKLDSTNEYTLFAPSNDAFHQMPQALQDYYRPTNQRSSVRDELQHILEYHATGDSVRLAELMDGQALYSAVDSQAKLFIRHINQSTYINGARLVPQLTDLSATNGIVHVVESVLTQVGSHGTAYVYLTENRSKFSKFLELLDSYESRVGVAYPGNDRVVSVLQNRRDDARLTLFVPTDTWINSNMDTNSFNLIKNNVDTLKRVVESHVIEGQVWHQQLLKLQGTQPLRAMHGDVVISTFGQSVYAANDCAKGRISSPDHTVDNGVVHEVEGLLGYVYNDIMDKLDERPELRDIAGLMRGIPTIRDRIDLPSGQTSAPTGEEFTVLAPVNDGIPGEIFNQLEPILLMHMINGRHPLVDLRNGTVLDTLRGSSYPARFYQLMLPDGTTENYVDVNQVRSKIIEADVCTYNGLVHIVDQVIGEPTKTFWEEIDDNIELSTLYESGRNTGYDVKFRDTSSRLTVFAPTNAAFEEMKGTAQGTRILENTKYLRNVIDRHIVSGEVVLSESDLAGRKHTLVTQFDKETIEVYFSNGVFYVEFGGSGPIRISQPNYRVKNGIMHIIDEVMFSTSPTASEFTSGVSRTTRGWGAALVSLLLVIVLCLSS